MEGAESMEVAHIENIEETIEKVDLSSYKLISMPNKGFLSFIDSRSA